MKRLETLEEAQQLRKTTWVKEANNVRDQTDALQKINSAGAARASANATSDVEAAIKVEYDKRPFEEFAVWVGGEADKCAPPAQP